MCVFFWSILISSQNLQTGSTTWNICSSCYILVLDRKNKHTSKVFQTWSHLDLICRSSPRMKRVVFSAIKPNLWPHSEVYSIVCEGNFSIGYGGALLHVFVSEKGPFASSLGCGVCACDVCVHPCVSAGMWCTGGRRSSSENRGKGYYHLPVFPRPR